MNETQSRRDPASFDRDNTLDLAQFYGHTPGPWEATRRDDAKGNWQDCLIEQAMNYGGLRVARVERVDGKGFTDARLIAAAPALLAECRRLQAENAKLRGALLPLVAVEERKLASLEKRPYSIGLVTVRERLEKARAALAEKE